MRTLSVSLQYRSEGPSQAGEITVVKAAVVEVLHELAEQPLPVSASRSERDDSLDPPLDEPYCGKPEAAALACSHARCRQVAEHDFAIGPLLPGVIGPPHHPQAVTAVRRSRPSIVSGFAERALLIRMRSASWRRCCSRSRRRAR